MRRWQWVICALLASGAFFYQGIPLRSQELASPVGVAPAQAQNTSDKAHAKKQRAIRRCVDYDQEQHDDGLNISLRNECQFDLTCTISWRVRCDEDEPGTQRSKAEVLSITQGMKDGAYASAAICGDDGWRVSNVRWSCRDDSE